MLDLEFYPGVPDLVLLVFFNFMVIVSAVLAFDTAKKKASKGELMIENVVGSINSACMLFALECTLVHFLYLIISDGFYLTTVLILIVILLISFLSAWIVLFLPFDTSAFFGHHFGTKKYIESEIADRMKHQQRAEKPIYSSVEQENDCG